MDQLGKYFAALLIFGTVVIFQATFHVRQKTQREIQRERVKSHLCLDEKEEETTARMHELANYEK